MTFKVGDRVEYKGREDSFIGTHGEVTGIIGGEYPFKIYWEDRTTSVERMDDLAHVETSSFEQSVRYHTNKIADLLIAKNKAYGDSALNPVRIFSKASRIEQLNVRIDDKISRIQRGTDFGDEDTVRDLVGYLLLRLIAEESE